MKHFLDCCSRILKNKNCRYSLCYCTIGSSKLLEKRRQMFCFKSKVTEPDHRSDGFFPRKNFMAHLSSIVCFLTISFKIVFKICCVTRLIKKVQLCAAKLVSGLKKKVLNPSFFSCLWWGTVFNWLVASHGCELPRILQIGERDRH